MSDAAEPSRTDVDGTVAGGTVADGRRLHRAGKLAEAEAVYRRILAEDPDHADALHGVGVIAHSRGRDDEAVDLIGRAIKRRPDNAAYFNDIAVALRNLGRNRDSAAAARKAIELRGDRPETHLNYGMALEELGRRDAALAAYRRALALRPSYANAHNCIGNIYYQAGDVERAAACYRRAVKFKPDFGKAVANLGTAMRALGRLDDAIALFRRAVALDPDHADAHNNLGLVLLARGAFAEGFAEYQWRWRTRQLAQPDMPEPEWDGASPSGRSIFVYAEQGFGDTIQFVRYLPLLRARGARVALGCQRPLARLLASCGGVDELVPEGGRRRVYDLRAPLLSLAAKFETTLETIPGDVPYLAAEPDLVAAWRARIEAIPGLRVGIAWAGNPVQLSDRERSIPLACFAPLGRIPNVRLISLQKEHGRDQLAGLGDSSWLEDLAPELDTGDDAFVDTAAVMMHLDLVITADTAVAHLAGALGRPVWLALKYVPDWRWMLEREDSPWYPTMRLFRQPRRGDWGPVFARLHADLDALAAGDRGRLAPTPWRGPPATAIGSG